MLVTLGLQAEKVKNVSAMLVYPQPSSASLMRSDVKRLFRDAEPAFVNVELNLRVFQLSGSGINLESPKT